MKRTYIKPFMESEEFVTNEYVAACWLVTCEEGESMIVKKEPKFVEFGGDTDNFVYTVTLNGPVRSYYGMINGKEGENEQFTVEGKFHIIQSVEKRDGNGPNAS